MVNKCCNSKCDAGEKIQSVLVLFLLPIGRNRGWSPREVDQNYEFDVYLYVFFINVLCSALR